MSAGAGPEPLLRLRPLGLGEILDEIFRVYRRHFGLLWAVALVLSVPSFLLQVVSPNGLGSLAVLLRSLSQGGNVGQLPALPVPDPLLLGLAYLLLLAAVPFTTGAVCRVGIDLALGIPVSVGSALAGVARRYWALMGLAVLLFLVSVPLSLCFPVAIWLLVRWGVAIPALLAEGIGPIRALDRSWTLTRGSWWRVFGILLLIGLLQGAVSFGLGLVAVLLGVAIPFLSSVPRGAAVAAISTGSSAVVLPVVYLCLVLLYFDLRIRRESFDLDQMARQTVGWPPPT